MSHQTGIKANEQLRTFFATSKEGGVRMFKVVINEREELALSSERRVTKPTWQAEYNECVLDAIEPRQPCYLFYRLDERTNSGFMWLFISWSPDAAPVKAKMLYAATKSTLKLEFGAGQVKDELFGTARDDLALDGYTRHLASQAAPAPLTNREEELELLRQGENHTRINVDSKHRTLQGVMFPLDERALQQLAEFKRAAVDYVRLAIDIGAERILLDEHRARLTVDELRRAIPADKGRFHLYRFRHSFEGDDECAPVVFVYSMPGFVCTVKERMLYSSCKSELIQFVKSEAGLDVQKTFEVSDPAEVTAELLIDELHPKKASDSRKFDKPKGPSSRGPRRVTRPHADMAASGDSAAAGGDGFDH